VLDVAGTDKVVPVIIDECKAAPEASFLKTVKSESSKK
jgi:hypothetical protein